MFGPVKEVAVDHDPTPLLAITAGLSASGIPCMGYWYDRQSNELKPAPDAKSSRYVRVVFMDLNLAEMGGIPETSSLFVTISDVLKQIIPPDAGPYLLVFWTQVG